MATINDIGVPGQPLNNPSLVAWQAATRDALTPTLGSLTPRAGWVDFGGAYAGLHVTRLGRIVNVAATLKPTADTALAIGTAINLADITNPALMPGVSVATACVYHLQTSLAANVGRLTINSSGICTFHPSAAGTMLASAGLLAFNLTYRSAT